MKPIEYSIVSDINDEVNASVTYQTDVQQYSNPEFWEPAGKLGDCEDYALLKRNKLLEAGADDSQLGLVICFIQGVPKKESCHCVLWVNTDKGGFILDNRYQGLQRPTDLDYTWDCMLRGTKWYTIVSWD